MKKYVTIKKKDDFWEVQKNDKKPKNDISSIIYNHICTI